MQHLEVSGAVRPLKWSLGVKWLMEWSQGVEQGSRNKLGTQNATYYMKCFSPCGYMFRYCKCSFNWTTCFDI